MHRISAARADLFVHTLTQLGMFDLAAAGLVEKHTKLNYSKKKVLIIIKPHIHYGSTFKFGNVKWFIMDQPVSELSLGGLILDK